MARRLPRKAQGIEHLHLLHGEGRELVGDLDPPLPQALILLALAELLHPASQEEALGDLGHVGVLEGVLEDAQLGVHFVKVRKVLRVRLDAAGGGRMPVVLVAVVVVWMLRHLHLHVHVHAHATVVALAPGQIQLSKRRQGARTRHSLGPRPNPYYPNPYIIIIHVVVVVMRGLLGGSHRRRNRGRAEHLALVKRAGGRGPRAPGPRGILGGGVDGAPASVKERTADGDHGELEELGVGSDGGSFRLVARVVVMVMVGRIVVVVVIVATAMTVAVTVRVMSVGVGAVGIGGHGGAGWPYAVIVVAVVEFAMGEIDVGIRRCERRGSAVHTIPLLLLLLLRNSFSAVSGGTS